MRCRNAGGEAGLARVIPGTEGGREPRLRTLKITLAYDGTHYVGWQRQAAGESIQGLLEAALGRLEGTPVTVHGAGRTDAGVHALGQVASVSLSARLDTATIVRALNAQLPRDVRVLAAEEASGDFHARFSARAKTYRYLVRTGPLVSPFETAYVWHVPEPIDVDRMQAEAASLVGTHDFAAFQSAGSSVTRTTRTLMRSEIRACTAAPFDPIQVPVPGALIAYEVCGDGFLRHMVRAIVGTLVDIGRGRARLSLVDTIAAGARAEAGPTAPAHGLFLVRVDYDQR